MKLARPVLLLLLAASVQAHVGSPDVYLDAQAGPYKLFVTIRPPAVIPGVAELEVRAEDAGVKEIRAVPVPLTPGGTQLAPVADHLKRSTQDPQFFTGSLWMMAPGSWQVRMAIEGTAGSGSVAIPVPSVALKTKGMPPSLAFVLFGLMLLLVAGMVLIIGASVREARLPAGIHPGLENRKRARKAMVVSSIFLCGVVLLGRLWWNAADANYRLKVYQPLQMAATVSPSGTLELHMSNPRWMNDPARRSSPNGAALFTRVMDDLVPDHEHLMHLYAIRQPGLDAVYHLHPELVQTGLFRSELPSMEPGQYQLYADVVHANGFAETMVARLTVSANLPARRLRGDDAGAQTEPWTQATQAERFTLPDGYVMQWVRPASGNLPARQGIPFRFRLVDAGGRPAGDMQFYMGMLGHAAFVKTDGSTFAHVHPTGSVPMASYMMAEAQLGAPKMQEASMQMDMPGMDMKGMQASGSLPNEVTFPYGLPSAGRYRIFVQMKHAGVIETGVFDVTAR